MKFLKMTVENFMRIAEAEVELNDRGLILIQGKNTDDTSANSNGSGKSTLMNALCWGIYGETANGLKADDVLSTGHEKNCRVSVTIEDEGKRYAIMRHRAHATNKNRLLVSCEDGDLTKGTDKLTQEFIEKLIGASKEVFLASIYASQENMPDLPGMTDKNLKAIVEEAAGVDRLTHSYDIARDRHNAKLAERDGVAGKITVADRAFISALETSEETVMSADEWERARKARIDDAKKAVNEAEVSLTEIEFANADCPSLESIDAKIAGIRTSISGVTEHDKKISDMTTAIAKARAGHGVKRSEIDRLKLQAKNAMEQAAGVSEKVGSPCTECGKPYCEADLATVKKGHTDKARADMVKITETLLPEITVIDEQLTKAEAVLESLKAARPNVDAEMDKVATLQRQRMFLEKSLTAEDTARTALTKARELLTAIESEKNPFTSLIEKTKAEAALLKDDLKTLRVTKEKLDGESDLLEQARKVFSPAGVRSHILSNVTPYLNAKTAEYLNTLSDGSITAVWSTMELTKKGEAKDKFNIAVSKEGASKSFAGLSGGEKRKVRIATALALQDLVASRATKNIQLFIGDEIDDALDVAGLERLMAILEVKARERGTVMIISHKEMKSWFRETITVESKGGRSYVC
ncbi:AAA family ATPase [Morganella psychrotolerans]|uniref:AAA family ATPase n=1 Tax=Morganella psychrotolerans TaxID=368603 RepID=A0A5M9R0J3_9GAMM|nr:AAA family ATPase [Morganella psychrotolerans]KAA8712995.1 AAA family ATPase [Morganella psychrotolerans]OBU01904.1 exonuclease [Morganella psychrotolerans]